MIGNNVVVFTELVRHLTSLGYLGDDKGLQYEYTLEMLITYLYNKIFLFEKLKRRNHLKTRLRPLGAQQSH